jgi:hypothetical protein
MELRCKGKLHGIVVREGSGTVEIKCRSRWCGAGPDNVILHRFDIATGNYTTKAFQNLKRKDK